MSSKTVRTEFKDFLALNWTVTPIQYTSIDLNKLKPALPENSLYYLVIEFVPAIEKRASIGDIQYYRERGTVRAYLVGPSTISPEPLQDLVEQFRDLFRSKAINDALYIVSVDPGDDRRSMFEGTAHIFSVDVTYYRDFNF